MYKAFKVSINPYDHEISSMTDKLNWKSFNVGADALRKLENYLQHDKVLSGDQIQKDWFPEMDADIFISHSHSDKTQAIKLANWLYENFNLVSFIDSTIWGHSDKLLREIDDEYCFDKDSNTYMYSLRNQSTSHVHMMLSNALTKMMDKCECIFFLNTPNSIISNDVIQKTYSPWIFLEISSTQTLRLVNKRMLLHENKSVFSRSQNAYIPIEHTLNFDNFIDLDQKKLITWKRAFSSSINNDRHPLDLLYDSKE